MIPGAPTIQVLRSCKPRASGDDPGAAPWDEYVDW